MNVLFNKKLLKHSPNAKCVGAYRLNAFVGKYPDTQIDFDPMPYIVKVHAQEWINRFAHECKTNGYMAEVNLVPESFECAVLAVGLAIKASETGNFAIATAAGHHARSHYPSSTV